MYVSPCYITFVYKHKKRSLPGRMDRLLFEVEKMYCSEKHNRSCFENKQNNETNIHKKRWLFYWKKFQNKKLEKTEKEEYTHSIPNLSRF